MIAIELRFPANRFHGTAWGRHVNEGVPEWPPSPYRLVRGLYDVWKRKHPEIPETRIERVFAALAQERPVYALAKGTASHTRSYLSAESEDPTDKSLVFDAFVAMDRGEACYLQWPSAQLDAADMATLQQLLLSLNYLGRSESWVEARTCVSVPDSQLFCEPATDTATGPTSAVACLVPLGEYQGKGRWIDSLAFSTTDLLKQRRSIPPLLRMTPYTGVSESLRTHVPRQGTRNHAHVGAVVLALDSKVLPLVTATVEIAEQIRTRLMGIHKAMKGAHQISPMFSGKGRDGKPLTGHPHAFILPLGNQKGRIDRVLIYTRTEEGFQSDEVQAILRVDELWQANDQPVRCVATWKGGSSDTEMRPLARSVVSATPFVSSRHTRRGRGAPGEFARTEILRECEHHGLPPPVTVDPIGSTGLFEWIEFRRNRRDDTPKPGFGFRLTFDTAVRTPFSLGYGCHFGLGQFKPE